MFLIVTFSQRGSLLSGAGVIRFGRMVANPDRTAFFWDYFRLGGHSPGTRTIGVSVWATLPNKGLLPQLE